jgi:hypothetical protein
MPTLIESIFGYPKCRNCGRCRCSDCVASKSLYCGCCPCQALSCGWCRNDNQRLQPCGHCKCQVHSCSKCSECSQNKQGCGHCVCMKNACGHCTCIKMACGHCSYCSKCRDCSKCLTCTGHKTPCIEKVEYHYEPSTCESCGGTNLGLCGHCMDCYGSGGTTQYCSMCA